jgi:hypothetical protein
LISEVPAANTQTKTIDAGLDPMYTDEFAIGYGRPLGPVWSAEVSAMYREVSDIFEDVSADGLGNGPFRVSQLPEAYREYTAATIQVRREPADEKWMGIWLDFSYTWSRLEGNWDIDYNDSLFYNSSILQDGPGVLITDNRDGLLRGDRTHVAKLFASIEPLERFRVGGFVRFQSGHAWEARALPSPNVSSSTHHAYTEPAGSRRVEDWLNFDLLATYLLPLGPLDVELEARVLNVFDEQATIDVDDRRFLNRSPVPNNPTFGDGTLYSPPRAFSVAASLRF